MRRTARQGAPRLAPALRPTWLLQIPTLLPEADREAFRTTVAVDGRDRMLREFVDAVAALAAAGRKGRLVVVALEDLQWSDPSSLDLVGALARGEEPTRLLVLITHRPLAGLAPGHPLRTLRREAYRWFTEGFDTADLREAAALLADLA